ncbi:CENPO protein, partial [Nesospiza acunhae]|nr:CENPO protein [Nesospiza acunhae]
DSFHLELQESRGFRELRVGRHSVPPCVPLQGLARRFLPGNLREFLAVLWRHLNAFVARRQQLKLLQEEFSECIQGTPCSNSLCNVLSFRCRIPGKNPQI